MDKISQHSSKRKKVLIITYYWPPCGGIGVLRCLKFAKYLRDFGWEPIIFTAKDAHYPSIDHTNEKDIPKDITVLRQKIWEPYHIYKLITGQKKDANVNNVFYVKDKNLGFAHKLSVWIRSNFFIPDARCFWIKSSVKYLTKYLAKNPVDVIFSDGPPHSNTRIATLLQQKTGIPWLADFQDPWTQIDYYQLLYLSKWGDNRHKKMEQAAFYAASKITIASPSWASDLEAIGAENVAWLPWGYDPADYENVVQDIDGKFTFTHLGIMGYDRNPEIFFRVLRELMQELPNFAENLCIKLVGQVDFSVKSAIDKYSLTENVDLVGSVSRQKALELTLSSPILLLLLNQQSNAKGRIPGKLFEYLASKRPILCLGMENSDVAKIIAETDSGYVCEYDGSEKIKATVKKLYTQYLEKKLQAPINSSIEQYSVKKLTGDLAKYLNQIAG
ncbi:MAG: glycosyl transferase family 1 [Bacteroidota bacterium]